MTAPTNTAPAPSRIAAVDLARGVALVAMAIYHLTWDLQFFGYVEPGTATTGGWKWFARAIASSFLFLVGVGLVLAHGRMIRWPGFMRRLAQIIAASLLITIATWFFTPQTYVFFGILHHIAVASVIGLAFLALPAWVTLGAAVAIFVTGFSVTLDAFDHPLLWWIGLSATRPLSNDFVPLLPWLSATLAGIGVWKLTGAGSLAAALASQPFDGTTSRWLLFFGRNSLVFYLVHQPVLIALVAAATWIAPPDRTHAREAGFIAQCEVECAATRPLRFCTAYCGCFLQGVQASGKSEALFGGADLTEHSEWLAQLTGTCSDQSEIREEPGQ